MPVDVLRARPCAAFNAGLNSDEDQARASDKLALDRAFKSLGDALDFAPTKDQKSLTSMRGGCRR